MSWLQTIQSVASIFGTAMYEENYMRQYEERLAEDAAIFEFYCNRSIDFARKMASYDQLCCADPNEYFPRDCPPRLAKKIAALLYEYQRRLKAYAELVARTKSIRQ
jgi:hypothetical protein